MFTVHTQLKKREEMLSQLQESEAAIKETWESSVERAELAERVQRVLEEEQARVQEDLAEQEKHVEGLERRLAEERRRREEEVGSLEQKLQQEQQSREQDIANCSLVITELKAKVSCG